MPQERRLRSLTMYIYRKVYDELRESLGSRVPECGGVLGAIPGEAVSEFYFDALGTSTESSYTPDVDSINRVLTEDWAPRGIVMVGIVHTHAREGNFPSCGDLYYCEQIMNAAGLTRFYLPVVTLSPFTLHAYTSELIDGHIKAQKSKFFLI